MPWQPSGELRPRETAEYSTAATPDTRVLAGGDQKRTPLRRTAALWFASTERKEVAKARSGLFWYGTMAKACSIAYDTHRHKIPSKETRPAR